MLPNFRFSDIIICYPTRKNLSRWWYILCCNQRPAVLKNMGATPCAAMLAATTNGHWAPRYVAKTFICCSYSHMFHYSQQKIQTATCKITSITLFRVIPTLTYCYDILSGIHSALFFAFYLTYILTFFLAVYLTYILTFFLAFYLTYILTFFLAFYLTYILTFYGILSFIYSDILWHSILHIFWHSMAFYLTYVLTFYLAFFLVFYLT